MNISPIPLRTILPAEMGKGNVGFVCFDGGHLDNNPGLTLRTSGISGGAFHWVENRLSQFNSHPRSQQIAQLAASGWRQGQCLARLQRSRIATLRWRLALP